MSQWPEFEGLVREIRDLSAVADLLMWDQETNMPPRGEAARARHAATLKAIVHARLCDARLGVLLDALAGDARVAADPARAATVRLVRRERDRAVRIPERLVKALAQAQGLAVEAWKRARAENSFEVFRPHVETLVALRREQADAVGHSGERYDALLDNYEPGMTTARLQPIFARLRQGLVPLARAVATRPAPRTDFLHRDAWDVDRQFDLSIQMIRAMGFDFDAGRLDRSAHPFSLGVSPGDVRLTTRLHRDDGTSAIFSALHEAGHGLYEQGLPFDGSPAGSAASMGLHESQSRLWENQVGRSRAFWRHWFPKVRALFPEPLADVDEAAFVAAVNHVQPSLVRVEADEVTYNLHILVRFELELALVHGSLETRDLPAAWNERYEHYLGLRPPDDKRGVLQDIHWAWGEFGYFPTYALGNMYAATLMEAANEALPGLWDSVAAGDLLPLRDWLRNKIHSRGHIQDAEDIVRDVAGVGLVETDFLDYLKNKYLDGRSP